MSNESIAEEEFGMTHEHMEMLMHQHMDQCGEKQCHQVTLNEATGDLIWGPCPDLDCGNPDHDHSGA